MSEVSFSAVAEVLIGGQLYGTPEIPFTLAGVTMILDVQQGADGPQIRVRSGPPVQPNVAKFDRTCMEPVVFKLFRNGEPMQIVELKKLAEVTTLDLLSGA